MAIPVVWGILIFFMHGIPGCDLVYRDFWQSLTFDKLAHVALFAVFVMTQVVAFRKQVVFRTLRQSARLWALCIALVYGALLEFLQSVFFFMRSYDPIDLIANGIGAFVGLLTFRLIYGPQFVR